MKTARYAAALVALFSSGAGAAAGGTVQVDVRVSATVTHAASVSAQAAGAGDRLPIPHAIVVQGARVRVNGAAGIGAFKVAVVPDPVAPAQPNARIRALLVTIEF